MPRFGPDKGYGTSGLVRNKIRHNGQSQAYEGIAMGMNPRQVCEMFWDFNEDQAYFDVDVPLMENTTNPGANIIPVGNTEFARALFEMPRAGVLLSAQLSAEDALAAHDTNYVTFAVTNKLGSGSGTTAMLAASDANTTKATGGVAISAVIGRPLTIHGTAANLRVAAGDVVEVRATSAGTLANVVDVPRVKLRFATIPLGLTPVIARTAGSPLVAPVDDSSYGEIICTLSATNEVNTAGWTFGDQLVVPGTRWMFEARCKIATVTTAERVIIGMASAYSATWDNVVDNNWFRLEASMALLAEADDGTTDSDDQSCGVTLTAATYYLFRIDCTDVGQIKFFVDDSLVKTLASSARVSTDLMQPIIAVQKASGTGVPSVTCDYMQLWVPRV